MEETPPPPLDSYAGGGVICRAFPAHGQSRQLCPPGGARTQLFPLVLAGNCLGVGENGFLFSFLLLFFPFPLIFFSISPFFVLFTSFFFSFPLLLLSPFVFPSFFLPFPFLVPFPSFWFSFCFFFPSPIFLSPLSFFPLLFFFFLFFLSLISFQHIFSSPPFSPLSFFFLLPPFFAFCPPCFVVFFSLPPFSLLPFFYLRFNCCNTRHLEVKTAFKSPNSFQTQPCPGPSGLPLNTGIILVFQVAFFWQRQTSFPQ